MAVAIRRHRRESKRDQMDELELNVSGDVTSWIALYDHANVAQTASLCAMAEKAAAA
jgi:hypothetical protein